MSARVLNGILGCTALVLCGLSWSAAPPPGELPVAQTSRPAKPAKATSKKTPAGTLHLETFPPELEVGNAIERVPYDRAPVRVALAAQKERRIYLPFEAALHVPAEAGTLQAQIIGSTLYLTAPTGLPAVRIVAEGLDGQGMIPLDLQVRDSAVGVPDEMEILIAPRGAGRTAAPGRRGEADEPAPPDLVQLTRYCAQQMYAPVRLIKRLPGVRSVAMRPVPVPNLYRGGGVITTPIGAWRSADHYVTAVRFTNRTSQDIELDMDLLRGHWVAATPQHHLLAPAGNEADTTGVCLISAQPFDAARP